jgi:hypothetical protein
LVAEVPTEVSKSQRRSIDVFSYELRVTSFGG